MPRRNLRKLQGAQSAPASHVVSGPASTTGSFTDMFTGDHEILRNHAYSLLPGLEGIGSPSTQKAQSPAEEHDRQLGLPPADYRPISAGRRFQHETFASYESPVSDTGTGRTQILDFEEQHVSKEPVHRRPSARPAIKEVGELIWGDSNPTHAESLETADAQDPASAGVSSSVPVNKTPGILVSSDKEDESAEDKPTDPETLARLVMASPDPRNLIYDSNSRFGSMGSPASNSQEPARHIDSLFADDGKPLANASFETSNHIAATQTSASVLEGIPLGDSIATADTASKDSERLPVMDALHIDTLARVSVQAQASHVSPATQKTQLTDSPVAPPAQLNGSLTLHDYVQQQKTRPDDLTPEQAHRQLDFRVSLLDHASSPKPRAVSLPVPPPQPSTPGMRPRSVFASPPVAAALGARNLPATFQSLAMALNEELADRVLFDALLGDGGALQQPALQEVQRQSLPSAQPLFDPETDTGENGVPESVVQAFMAGDLTAIDRFFAHVMKLTAPASVFDGDFFR
ncbi:hypothetical protein DL89DRAFT_65081 [Linderina pennispora]|uniref:Uncharacterized protein n=1 Tax=Linderina pennispora TaxID=61395 RepID=A0A1Y1VZW0_9FUNG|nr:uncharacterized protein DL89DRAFT_65081 [Linderina pennispora]ORX66565.1 hypothetical protein DL89DRAFT_65081 [Linderina pennispora]